MARSLSPLRFAPALLAMLAGGLGMAGAAQAQDSPIDLFSAQTLSVYGDLRAGIVDGEKSWLDGGFGKLVHGASGSGAEVHPQVGEAGIVWQPRLGWALSGTIVAAAQGGGERPFEAGLSEAYLTYKPLGNSLGPVRLAARAGLFWPPVSLEHSGPEWTVTDTITPSAIGSWIGEEVKVAGLELTAKAALGAHGLALTAGVFDANDTAGTLLSFRGWAMHDRKALAFRAMPLPPLNAFVQTVQPPFSHPVLNIEPRLFQRPGWYAKLAWSPPLPLRLEAFHYENGANPEALNADYEWGWQTRFDTIGLIVDASGGTQLRVQGLSGQTRMGFPMPDLYWIDMRFRAAYAAVTQRMARTTLTARVDLFDTRNHGSAVDQTDDETGWAMTLAARRTLGPHLSAVAEYLRVDSDKGARIRAITAPRQVQNQLQLALRARW